jgi:predicted ribosome quality control (RQC) complex YloA/Tae2 family protein
MQKRETMHHEPYTALEKQRLFNREKQALQKNLSKQLKKLRKKEEDLRNNLKQCAEWPKFQHEGDLIKAHLPSIKKGTSNFTVHDWMSDQSYHLNFDPAKTPHEEMIARFKRAKKLQRGQAPLMQYLERIQKGITDIEEQQRNLSQVETLEELANFKNLFPAALPLSRPSVREIPRPPIYREYRSASGIQIWVGKNAKANDRLTFQLANGRDWWLHARNCPGSHIIIRLDKDQEPDHETLQDALQLALHYSKARAAGEGEICFTQRKYVSQLKKGKAGQVQISKHQIAYIRYDAERFLKLKERNFG